jgi:hypothetical protein
MNIHEYTSDEHLVGADASLIKAIVRNDVRMFDNLLKDNPCRATGFLCHFALKNGMWEIADLLLNNAEYIAYIESIVEMELRKNPISYQTVLPELAKDFIVPIILMYEYWPDSLKMRNELEKTISLKYSLFERHKPFVDMCFDILINVHANIVYAPVLSKIRSIAKSSGLLQEICETATALLYKPGSTLVRPIGKWSPDQKAINRELSELYKKNDTVVIPKNKRTQEWKIICCQLGEFRKDELLHLAWQMDLGVYLNPLWNKSQISKFMFKYMSIFQNKDNRAFSSYLS